MKRHIHGGLFAGAACICIAGALMAQEAAEPEVNGKPLSELYKDLRSDNRGKQVRAAKALADAPESLRAQIVPQVLPVLKSPRENDKFVAAQVLGAYGPAARIAIPELLPLLTNKQYERNRSAAAKALGMILKDAPSTEEVEQVVQALLAVFDDYFSDVRREAVTACGMIGPAAKACIPYLPKRMADDDTVTRPQPWLDKTEHILVEQAAVWTTGKMGPLAACHMDLLISLAQGKHKALAAEAIGRIGAMQDNIVPNLMTLIENNDSPPEAKRNAIKALVTFGAKAEGAIALLDRLLRDRKLTPDEAADVIRIFKAIGPKAASTRKTIEGLVNATAFEPSTRAPAATPAQLAEIKKLAAEAMQAIDGK